MDYVEGRGTKDGNQVTIAIGIEGGGYRVLAPIAYKAEIEDRLRGPIFAGGTYETEDGTLLKAYCALDEFFRGRWESKVSGTLEEIPMEPDMIY